MHGSQEAKNTEETSRASIMRSRPVWSPLATEVDMQLWTYVKLVYVSVVNEWTFTSYPNLHRSVPRIWLWIPPQLAPGSIGNRKPASLANHAFPVLIKRASRLPRTGKSLQTSYRKSGIIFSGTNSDQQAFWITALMYVSTQCCSRWTPSKPTVTTVHYLRLGSRKNLAIQEKRYLNVGPRSHN